MTDKLLIQETVRDTLGSAELRAVFRQVAEDAAQETVRRTFLTLGIDTADPLKVQADMRHLRDWRETLERMKARGATVLVSVLLTSGVGALWFGLKHTINQ